MKTIIIAFIFLISFGAIAEENLNERTQAESSKVNSLENAKSSRERFNNLSEKEKNELRGKYKRWSKLSKGQQKVLKNRHAEWKKLSPEKRKTLRQNYKKYKRMDKSKRIELLGRLKKFKKLSPDERKKRLFKLQKKKEILKSNRNKLERTRNFKGKRNDPRRLLQKKRRKYLRRMRTAP